MSVVHGVLGLTGFLLLCVASGYETICLLAVLVWSWRRRSRQGSQLLQPVTLLKPLCGGEPGLYDNLRSFCQQSYPIYQVVFGLNDERDPALEIVGRLVSEFPALPIDVVVSSRQHGSNRKVSNLINMMPRAKHDIIVIADSDAKVGPDYLTCMVAPLSEPDVGLVTCIYRGVATSGIWSRLGAMYINEWYMPSVLVAWLFGDREYASGLTLCLRRETLEAVGGLHGLSNHLADDYELGARVRAIGQSVALSGYLPSTEHAEATRDQLLDHESRWMHTIRVLRPKSFRFLFLSFSLPLAALGMALSGELRATASFSMGLFLATLSARVALFCIPRLRSRQISFRDLWLLPLRDLLLWWVWLRALRSSQVNWRGYDFMVDSRGIMRSLS